MSKFKQNAISEKLKFCIKLADEKLSPGSKMMNYISIKNDWKYDSGSGEDVVKALLKPKAPICVYVVKPKRKTKAVAYYQNGDIYLYSTYLETAPLESIVATLVHEYSHYCGFHHNSRFWTSNFKTQHKVDFSVPYHLSDGIEKGIF